MVVITERLSPEAETVRMEMEGTFSFFLGCPVLVDYAAVEMGSKCYVGGNHI